MSGKNPSDEAPEVSDEALAEADGGFSIGSVAEDIVDAVAEGTDQAPSSGLAEGQFL